MKHNATETQSATLRRYFDLTTAERLALTDDELDRLCQIELMVAGKAYPNPPAYLDVPETPKPDLTAYRIGGLVFLDRADADAVFALNPSITSCNWKAGYSTEYISDSVPSVETVRVFSKEAYSRLEASLIAAHSSKETNESLKAGYEKATEECDEILRSVKADRNDLWEVVSRYETIVSRFERFTSLTGGDIPTAVKFLLEQYSRTDIRFALEWKGLAIPKVLHDELPVEEVPA